MKGINTKLLIFLIAGLFFYFSPGKEAKACDIDFEVIKGEKKKYEKGDEVIIKVVVTLTHRTCPVGIKETKFRMDGMKVVAATSWSQKSTMVWERKLKTVIKSNEEGKLVISGVRKCDKDGGYGSLKLEAVPVKS